MCGRNAAHIAGPKVKFGTKTSVHYIDVHSIGPLRLNCPAFRTEIGEVCSKDRRRDTDRIVGSHPVLLLTFRAAHTHRTSGTPRAANRGLSHVTCAATCSFNLSRTKSEGNRTDS